MANLDRPHGFDPVRYLSGVPYNGSVRRYKKEASTIIAKGDAVVITGTAEATTAIPLVDRAAAGSGTITGVVIAIDPLTTDLSKTHLAAADTGYVLVADNPELLFQVQEDGDTDPIAITDVGEGCDIIVADANTTLGLSVMELNSDNAGTGDQVQIMELAQMADNALGAYAEWIVRINEHTYNSVATMV